MQLVGWGSGTSTSCDTAVRGVANHPAGAVLDAPDAALGVDRQPVRERPAGLIDGREYSAIQKATRVGLEVVSEDRVAEALAEEEGGAVRAPAETVGTDHRTLLSA
jgi:hypothetical protein